MTLSTGNITQFNKSRGFGFITPDCGGIEVFVHNSSVMTHENLHLGMRVEYLTRLGTKGSLIAENVRIILTQKESDCETIHNDDFHWSL